MVIIYKKQVSLDKLLNNFVLKTLRKYNMVQISTKNKKMCNLQSKQQSYNYSKVLIINLSPRQSIDISPLEHGLKQYFVDKNKYIKTLSLNLKLFAVPWIKIFHQMIMKIFMNF